MNRLALYSGLAFFALIVLTSSIFVLDQRSTALVLQFGSPQRQIITPGLQLKVPFIQDVFFFDNRIHNFSAATTEVISSDQKNLYVDAFVKYRIADVLKFYQRAKDEHGFKSALSPILESSLRQVLGSYQFKSLLTAERANIMLKIRDSVQHEVAEFGVKIIDVRIMRADLPDTSRQSVYERMSSERAKEAKEIRAEGAEQAQKIMAGADKEKLIILAEARKKAEIMRGEGDAEAIKAFAESFGRDPEFFEFYRTMQAYRKTLNSDSTRVIVSPDSDFLKYLKKSGH
jgi:membrane protease subunit HflC